MAIKMSEFMKELRTSRAGIDPKEKLRQLQELKQQSQFKSPEKEKSGSVSPTLIVLSADPQKQNGEEGEE